MSKFTTKHIKVYHATCQTNHFSKVHHKVHHISKSTRKYIQVHHKTCQTYLFPPTHHKTFQISPQFMSKLTDLSPVILPIDICPSPFAFSLHKHAWNEAWEMETRKIRSNNANVLQHHRTKLQTRKRKEQQFSLMWQATALNCQSTFECHSRKNSLSEKMKTSPLLIIYLPSSQECLFHLRSTIIFYESSHNLLHQQHKNSLLNIVLWI